MTEQEVMPIQQCARCREFNHFVGDMVTVPVQHPRTRTCGIDERGGYICRGGHPVTEESICRACA